MRSKRKIFLICSALLLVSALTPVLLSQSSADASENLKESSIEELSKDSTQTVEISTATTYTNDFEITEKDLYKLSGDIIILVRKFHKLDILENRNIVHMIDYIKKIKKNFSKVVYFDDSAAISHILFFIVPYVDSYWVRGLFKDTNLYSKSFYGGRSFSDYYNKKYDIKDKNIYLSPKNNGKFPANIKIAWNIGIGCYPTANEEIFNYYYSNIRKIRLCHSPY